MCQGRRQASQTSSFWATKEGDARLCAAPARLGRADAGERASERGRQGRNRRPHLLLGRAPLAARADPRLCLAADAGAGALLLLGAAPGRRLCHLRRVGEAEARKAKTDKAGQRREGTRGTRRGRETSRGGETEAEASSAEAVSRSAEQARERERGKDDGTETQEETRTDKGHCCAMPAAVNCRRFFHKDHRQCPTTTKTLVRLLRFGLGASHGSQRSARESERGQKGRTTPPLSPVSLSPFALSPFALSPFVTVRGHGLLSLSWQPGQRALCRTCPSPRRKKSRCSLSRVPRPAPRSLSPSARRLPRGTRATPTPPAAHASPGSSAGARAAPADDMRGRRGAGGAD